MTKAIEFYTSGINSRTTYANENQSTELYKQLQIIFPWVKQENYVSISTPNYHEVLVENVVTCQLPAEATAILVGDGVAEGLARKFCMSSKKSYLRAYYLYKGGTPDWLPSSCTLMCSSNNIAEYGRPFPAQASTFTDYYFSGDPATVEEHFDLPERRGAHATFYGVTREGGTTRRVKQYCYDEETASSEWVALYNFLNEGS